MNVLQEQIDKYIPVDIQEFWKNRGYHIGYYTSLGFLIFFRQTEEDSGVFYPSESNLLCTVNHNIPHYSKTKFFLGDSSKEYAEEEYRRIINLMAFT